MCSFSISFSLALFELCQLFSIFYTFSICGVVRFWTGHTKSETVLPRLPRTVLLPVLSHLSLSFFSNWQCHAKFLNVFFALINVFAIFNSAGALFHSLIASPRKLAFALHETPNSIHFPLEHPLVSLPFSGWVCLSPFTGYSTSFSIFHISVNFICAFVWFTDSILFLASILSMLTLSLILLFSTVLSILFCANCIPFICLVFHWSSVVLTLAQSWRPYLSLDVQILSTIF